jgi:hypothetical protein
MHARTHAYMHAYITLRYVAVQYINIYSTVQYIALHCITLHCIPIRYNTIHTYEKERDRER